MNALLSALQKYVTMRRGMGFKFRHQEKRLTSFVRFMEERGASVITNKLAIEWATLPKDRRPSWALRLTDVRGFARHLQGLDAQTEVPPTGILPGLSSIIALWLGHESVETTQVYLHAHLAIKEAALAKIKPLKGKKPDRYHPGDQLLTFLNAL